MMPRYSFTLRCMVRNCDSEKRSVGWLPDHYLCPANSLIIDALSPDSGRFVFTVVALSKQPDPVLALLTGDRYELVEDPARILPGRPPVEVSDSCQHFLSPPC